MTRATPAIQVGSLALATRASGVCDVGERGVCYEVYELDGRPGFSFLFEQGRYDGFCPEDVALFLTITGEVCAAVTAYQFTNVTRLQRDWAQGRFAAAFPSRPSAPLSTSTTANSAAPVCRHHVAMAPRACKDSAARCNRAEGCGPPPQPEEETTMLRMDHYPYSRFWAIWDDQDLVAVVVYKKGAAELLRRLQAPAPPPASAGAAAPATPTAAVRPGDRRGVTRRSRRLTQG
jgi:hypothetical protein